MKNAKKKRTPAGETSREAARLVARLKQRYMRDFGEDVDISAEEARAMVRAMRRHPERGEPRIIPVSISQMFYAPKRRTAKARRSVAETKITAATAAA